MVGNCGENFAAPVLGLLPKFITDEKALANAVGGEYQEQRTVTGHLHLLPRHRELLERLLKTNLPDVTVWAYGSRINGRSHDGSDLDLVLRSRDLTEIPGEQLAGFREAFRESTMPFLVEAHDWARLPESFHREIERDYVVLG